jgi:hypothetical protein
VKVGSGYGGGLLLLMELHIKEESNGIKEHSIVN